ncbi:MAG: hypothetical protein U1F24_14085 [Alphaproteobacteria bacterium]
MYHIDWRRRGGFVAWNKDGVGPLLEEVSTHGLEDVQGGFWGPSPQVLHLRGWGGPFGGRRLIARSATGTSLFDQLDRQGRAWARLESVTQQRDSGGAEEAGTCWLEHHGGTIRFADEIEIGVKQKALEGVDTSLASNPRVIMTGGEGNMAFIDEPHILRLADADWYRAMSQAIADAGQSMLLYRVEMGRMKGEYLGLGISRPYEITKFWRTVPEHRRWSTASCFPPTPGRAPGCALSEGPASTCCLAIPSRKPSRTRPDSPRRWCAGRPSPPRARS